ncbi:MAG: hypothetical protein Q8L77_08205 [Nitrospirota bacterium]|nr:hypothetical protein [Nitrospirota bacterium]
MLKQAASTTTVSRETLLVKRKTFWLARYASRFTNDGPTVRTAFLSILIQALSVLALSGTLAFAVPMLNDPNGFEGIPWGAAFSETDTFTKIEDTGRAQTYELKTGAPSLGPAKVDSMRFLTVDGKFARVTVRYQGKATHDQILTYLQSRYGSLDRTPGQFTGGSVKFYSWTGFESDINLRYEIATDRGIIFFESQELRLKITEGNSATVF